METNVLPEFPEDAIEAAAIAFATAFMSLPPQAKTRFFEIIKERKGENRNRVERLEAFKERRREEQRERQQAIQETSTKIVEAPTVAAGIGTSAYVPTAEEIAQAKADKKAEKEARKARYAEANKNRKELAAKLKSEKATNAQTEEKELEQLKKDAAKLSATDRSLRAVLIRRKLQIANKKAQNERRRGQIDYQAKFKASIQGVDGNNKKKSAKPSQKTSQKDNTRGSGITAAEANLIKFRQLNQQVTDLNKAAITKSQSEQAKPYRPSSKLISSGAAFCKLCGEYHRGNVCY